MNEHTTSISDQTTIGLDLGDKFSHFCILDSEGDVIQENRVSTTAGAFATMFESRPPCLVAMEAGTHSPWVSRVIEGWGHRVLVADPRKLRAIYKSAFKTDKRDAEMLARIARVDVRLFHPIHHRGARAQAHLALVKSRDALVSARTALINHCRGMVKSSGARLSSCSADAFAHKVAGEIPPDLAAALGLVLVTIDELTAKIKNLDHQVEALCKEYPETEKLRAVKGVGPLTALSFVLTLEEPQRFAKSRAVAVYLGLVPRRDQSGETDKQLRITKEGDLFLRRLLVSCAHYILGPFGQDSDLQRWGLKMCARGGKNAKRRAVVAVARKLAVVLHRLWTGDQPYDPFYHTHWMQERDKKKIA